jgi:hypothetical protein
VAERVEEVETDAPVVAFIEIGPQVAVGQGGDLLVQLLDASGRFNSIAIATPYDNDSAARAG